MTHFFSTGKNRRFKGVFKQTKSVNGFLKFYQYGIHSMVFENFISTEITQWILKILYGNWFFEIFISTEITQWFLEILSVRKYSTQKKPPWFENF